MILQLQPTIWLKTAKGTGLAHFIIDYGEEHDILWGICMDDTGEWWWLANPEVRGLKNISLGAPREPPKASS